ncbi:unnamed protein product [Brachionus calyciflorus]|uniref:Maestro heat-like repeat-containing protein family member 1 n=1 Tax=Brachionus calyciflorus TaxID=104777 RepID=A0A813TK39_9BILA|nr:unnamed protein product [Brachionus calyciflorus]
MSFGSMYQLENLLIGLLEAINDKNPDVQESVSESIVALGRKKPEYILNTSLQFMTKNLAKLTDPHKSSIFNTMEKIIKDNIDELEESLALKWIEIASNEMIQNKEKDQPISLQTSASNLLGAIGSKFVKEVFSQLQKNFNPGTLPHLFIISTMAYLAEVNPYGVVPNLTSVLSSMLPMLGMAKLDNYKCAFGSALCKFSEAILYYCSNKDKAPDQSIEISNFSNSIYAAHEVFFNVWIKSSDPKVRQITIESIGQFVNLISHDKLEADVVKIIPGLLGLYKKHPDHLVVSQSLYLTISAVISAHPIIMNMDNIFEPLVKELFVQVLGTIEQQLAKNPNQVSLASVNKNQNEILRCFAELTKRYSDRMIPFLLQKFEQNNEKNRIASLTILRHIINSCDEQMLNKKQIVISGVRILLSDPNNRVKKNLIQTIIAMAYHDYLKLEGGFLMVEFILKQCSLADDDKKSQPEDATNEQLRISAENILTLFATTVENMHPILWPALFEYLTHNDYSRSTSVICKNLAHIAEQKREADSDDFIINYEAFINVAKPFEILARLIVLCGCPLNGKSRGLNVLSLMKNFAPNIDCAIVDVWDSVVPKLIANLEDKLSNSKFVQKTWEELIMKLLSNSLDQIANEEKFCEIAKCFGKQIETLYNNMSDEKHFAFKCLGVILNKTSSKNTIDRQLDIIFNSVNHTSQHEREGCAISFGYASSSHLDTVLLKLETYAKNESKKSSGGLFSGLMKDSNKNGDPDQIKSTIILAYGYVTFYSPKDLIISRLEANILRSVSGYAAVTSKDLNLKQNILKSIDIITKCMHQDHLQKDFNFSYKNTILNQIIAYINTENSKILSNEIKAMSFKICSNIVKLNPKPTEADIYLLIKSSIDSFYPLQVPSDDKKTDSSQTNQEEIQDTLHGNQLYEQTMNSLDELLKNILDRDLNNTGLGIVYKHLEPWLTSVNDHERLRSIRSLSSVLKHFVDNFKPTQEDLDNKVSFESFGNILGRIVSRVTDPVIQIRIITLDCINSLLKALQIYNQDFSEDQTEALNNLKQNLVKNSPNILLPAVNDLSKILCKKVPGDEQLTTFIEKLIDGLLDVQSHCSSASCIFLNYCVKLRGLELKDYVDNLIRHLYTKLNLIQNSQAKLGTLRTIRVLFQQHLIEALNVILTFPIPCNKEMTEICQNLCEDSPLINNLLDHLLQIWTRCLPYEEKNMTKYASITPLVGTCILNEIFSTNATESTEKVFNDNFEKIFSALVIRVSSSLSNVMPYPKSKDDYTEKKDDSKNSTKSQILNDYKKIEPAKVAIDCFKSFVKCTQINLFEYYNNENVWDLLSQESTSIEGYTILAKGLCLNCKTFIPKVVTNLNTYLSAPFDCQKISTTAFYAELMNHECSIDLVEQLLNSLLTKLIDPCLKVRTLCIRGLGNISSLGKEQVQKHSTTILSAMMAGLDDKNDLNDDITFESMNGLTKIIALIDENNVRPILINILLRIRPCFEKDKADIRASSYILFGELARFGQGPSKDPYLEQIHSNFVSFILHLNEQEEKVKKSCKFVLKQVGPLIQSNSINELFQNSLQDNKSLHYGEFINDLSKLLVNEFPEKVSFYIMNSVSNFKSEWTPIRSNSVLFAGYLLGHLSKEKQSQLSKEHISNALIKLLREDSSSMVRQKAAEAISLLADF